MSDRPRRSRSPRSTTRQRRRDRVVCFGRAIVVLALGCGLGVAHAAPAGAEPARAAAPVDVNGATRAELMKLPGIGAAQADRIISGRPYLSKADLVARKAIPAGTYLSIKGLIIARQDAPAGPRAMPDKR